FTSAGSAQVQISLVGYTAQNHLVNVSVNGNLVGSVQFAGTSTGTQTLNVPFASLVEGVNEVKLQPTLFDNGQNDLSFVDYIRLSYPHSLKADGNALDFTIKSTQTARVDGF